MMKTKIAFGVGSALLLFAPLLTFASFDRDLQYGSIGNDVTELQEFLTVQGNYTGPITGNFYSLTQQGVINFQLEHGIEPPAGYFGPITRTTANALLDERNTASDTQAIQETGSVPEPAKDDLVSLLQAQVNALLAQLNELTAQVETQTAIQQQTQNTLQQTQQSIQQIQQNTAPAPPAPLPTPTPAPQVVKDLVLRADQTTKAMHYGGSADFTIKASYTENGEAKPATITIVSPEKTVTREEEPDHVIANSYFKATEPGTYTISASANGITKSVEVTVTPYIEKSPVFQKEFVYNKNNEPVDIPNLVVGKDISGAIAVFSVSDADEPYKIDTYEYTTNMEDSATLWLGNKGGRICSNTIAIGGKGTGIFTCDTGHPGDEKRFSIHLTQPKIPGTYFLTFTKMRVIGQTSGLFREVAGLPVKFNFVIVE